MAFELLLLGGTIVDGSGGPGFPGAVGVTQGRLSLLRDPGVIEAAARTAARTLDVTGKVVAPGFIDLHSHSGLMILTEPLHEPKVRQGVTTEVIGVDGNGYAPFLDPADLAAFVELNAGLDGHPDGVAIDWDTVASYLERFEGRVSVNLAVLVGNAPLRIAAVGWEDEVADARAVERMRSMLREGMEAGAFGISSGLDYPPGSFASTEELTALANEAGRLGGIYHTHVRYPLGDRFL
ncbi:MAG: D-aminoacylase, partial [Candidatus Limnocylindrales bacterium]